eukprot:CAMPEP_0198452326 /NCGR_PEP_ID=MMETSP1453-20131121/6435_1 /TAXON_ID=1461543 ORGANISM="Unidentified sp., Strain RCC701" /NCGR_SAMPLE_ID=MMETSP1453 /ASSEMBLY_ACC=CAM_ASM_001118 /LENGTH=45 /DNA_ID= /DNA_START= /DNA_END= /DNA_ORIENTATION=
MTLSKRSAAIPRKACKVAKCPFRAKMVETAPNVVDTAASGGSLDF